MQDESIDARRQRIRLGCPRRGAAATQNLANVLVRGDGFGRHLRECAPYPEYALKTIEGGEQILDALSGARIDGHHGNSESIRKLQRVYRLSGAGQQIDHRQGDDCGLSLASDQAAKLQVTLELCGVSYKNKCVRFDAGVAAFDDFNGEFFLRRRGHAAVHARQVDDVARRTKLSLAPATEQRDGHTRIVGGFEVTPGEGIHECGLA